MKILELRSENIKRLTVVQITPTGSLVQITGQNGEGKSSTLDSIWLALDAASAEQSKPIRRGQKSARVQLTLGAKDGTTLIVERRFTEKGSTLYVSTPDGATYRSPQKMIDGLVGALAFDPLEFIARMDAREQFETLRRVVKIPVDLDELDKQRTALFEKRREVNREYASLGMRAKAITVADGLPETAPDRKAIMDRLAAVDNFNAFVRMKSQQREAAQERAALKTSKCIDLADELTRMVERQVIERNELEGRIRLAAAAESEAKSARAALDAVEIEPLQDPAAIRAELEEADRVIAEVQKRNTKKALEDETLAEGVESDRLTQAIMDIESVKTEAIANTPMPIEGLSFADGAVLFNGIPLNQASSAEQLRVSAAIGAALNPKLRVMLVHDGSLLDSKSLALLAEFAEKNDFQVWCERVDETGAVGIVIEDGHVKGQEEMVLAFEKEQAEAAKPPAETV